MIFCVSRVGGDKASLETKSPDWDQIDEIKIIAHSLMGSSRREPVFSLQRMIEDTRRC